MWDDVFGEPEGIRSTDCAWNCSYKCFKGTKGCCYLLLTTFFAPCLAFCSAINFACLAFQVSQKTFLVDYIYTFSGTGLECICAAAAEIYDLRLLRCH